MTPTLSPPLSLLILVHLGVHTFPCSDLSPTVSFVSPSEGDVDRCAPSKCAWTERGAAHLWPDTGSPLITPPLRATSSRHPAFRHHHHTCSPAPHLPCVHGLGGSGSSPLTMECSILPVPHGSLGLANPGCPDPLQPQGSFIRHALLFQLQAQTCLLAVWSIITGDLRKGGAWIPVSLASDSLEQPASQGREGRLLPKEGRAACPELCSEPVLKAALCPELLLVRLHG